MTGKEGFSGSTNPEARHANIDPSQFADGAATPYEFTDDFFINHRDLFPSDGSKPVLLYQEAGQVTKLETSQGSTGAHPSVVTLYFENQSETEKTYRWQLIHAHSQFGRKVFNLLVSQAGAVASKREYNSRGSVIGREVLEDPSGVVAGIQKLIESDTMKQEVAEKRRRKRAAEESLAEFMADDTITLGGKALEDKLKGLSVAIDHSGFPRTSLDGK